MATRRTPVKVSKEILIEATNLGHNAFLTGRKCIPHHDVNLSPLYVKAIANFDNSEHARIMIKVMDAWTKAWHLENLKN